jgi:hypothetical protein
MAQAAVAIPIVDDSAQLPEFEEPKGRGNTSLLAKLKNDADKRGQIVQHWTDDKEARRPYDYTWLDGLNMVGGNQWAFFSPTNRAWTQQAAPFPGFPLLEADLLTNDVGILKSRLLTDFPIPTALPYGVNDPTGNSAKRAARWTALYNELWPRMRDEKFLTSMAYHLIVLGNVFRTIGWDPTAGKDTIKSPIIGMIPVFISRAFCRNCEEPFDLDDAADALPEEHLSCPRCNMGGTQAVTKIEPEPREIEGQIGEEDRPQGECALHIVPAYEVWKPAAAPSLTRCTHIHRHRFMDVSWVYKATGKRVEAQTGIRAEDNWDIMIQEITSGSFNQNMGNASGNNRFLKHATGFHEFWELPGVDPDYPKGMYVQCHGNDLEPLVAYDYDWQSTVPFGLVHDKWEELNGRFWGRSHVEKLIPIQRWVNALISTIAYDRKRLSRRLVLNRRGSGLKAQDLTGSSLIADLRDPTKDSPRVLDLGGADDKLLNELNTAVSLFERVSGLQDILRGQAPPNQRTASGMNELREQAEAPIISIVRNVYASEKDLAEEARRLIIEHYLPDRLVMISQSGSLKTSGFLAEELGVKDSAPEYQGEVDLRIDLEAASSLTRVEKLNAIVALRQLFPSAINENDPQVMSRLMQLWRIDAQLYSPSNQVQKERAEREMRKALAGDPSEMMVTFGDDDPTHMAIHLNFLMSSDGFDIYKTDQEKYMQVYEHFLEHARRNAETQAPPVQPGAPGNGAGPQPAPQPQVARPA